MSHCLDYCSFLVSWVQSEISSCILFNIVLVIPGALLFNASFRISFSRKDYWSFEIVLNLCLILESIDNLTILSLCFHFFFFCHEWIEPCQFFVFFASTEIIWLCFFSQIEWITLMDFQTNATKCNTQNKLLYYHFYIMLDLICQYFVTDF